MAMISTCAALVAAAVAYGRYSWGRYTFARMVRLKVGPRPATCLTKGDIYTLDKYVCATQINVWNKQQSLTVVVH